MSTINAKHCLDQVMSAIAQRTQKTAAMRTLTNTSRKLFDQLRLSRNVTQ